MIYFTGGSHEPKIKCPVNGELRFRVAKIELLTNAQFTNNVEVPLRVLATYVVEKTPSTAHQPKEAPPRRIVFAVSAHVLGQAIDPLGQDANLHLWRAGISV